VGEGVVGREGAVTTLTKQLSEADVALFQLVTGETQVTAEEPPIPARQTRQAAPMALVGALLATAAAQHSLRPDLARFLSQTVTFHEPAYNDDTLTVTAQVAEHDGANRSLRIVARCDNQDGRRLANGEFLLSEE
jgi:acyl dehydratase